MRKIVAVILFICSALIPAYANGWYINQRGNPTVLSDDGRWYMMLSKTVNGSVNVYLLPRTGAICSSNGSANSMFVNGTKVRWWQNCDKDLGMYWYAYTNQGINYVIGQFINGQSVTIQDNSLVITFSAMGFINTSKQFISELTNPGL